jgi:hypothetical protein
LGGGDKALVSTLGILGLIDGESVIARFGERVDFRTPAIGPVSPARDRLAFLGGELVEVGKGRTLRLLLAEVGLDPLSGHHDTRLVLLREVDLGLRLSAEKGRTRWEGWEAVEWSKARMAAIGVGQFDRRICGTGGVALGVLRGREGEGGERVVGDGRRRGRLAIGIVVRINDAAGGVEVGEAALIRAVQGCGTLLNDEPLL